jgi:ferredoxin/flavodoxin---NADP+ reductase
MRRMSIKILDSLEILGGQLTTLYPEKYIYDVAGFPSVLAKELSKSLVEQAMQYRPQICLGEQVRQLVYDEPSRIYTVHTSTAEHAARSILIAAGVGSFTPKKLALADAARFEGHGLHYAVGDLSIFRDQRVLIVGGGDSAVDWANTLESVAQSVTLIHRRDQFRAHEDSVEKMKRGRTHIVLFHELKAISGGEHVESATIYDNRSNSEQILEADHVLVNIGFANSLGPIREWDLELDGSAIKVDSTMRTNRPGIFAAGDIVTYPGKLKLIATGFGEACTAVNYAKAHIDPGAKAFPGHSSEMKR